MADEIALKHKVIYVDCELSDKQFQVRNSKPTTAFLVCQKDDLQSGTIVKAQIQGNKLIIEKLPIYDGKGIVMVILASGFVGEASEAQLSPVPSAKINITGKDYTYFCNTIVLTTVRLLTLT